MAIKMQPLQVTTALETLMQQSYAKAKGEGKEVDCANGARSYVWLISLKIEPTLKPS